MAVYNLDDDSIIFYIINEFNLIHAKKKDQIMDAKLSVECKLRREEEGERE